MPVLPRKGLLAIAAVIDVAVNAAGRPVSAKVLAARHKLPPRHLEPVLQALVRDGILKGMRGPHGGYELGRDGKKISANDILRSAGRVDDEAEPPGAPNPFVDTVRTMLADAEKAFGAALMRITIEDMTAAVERRK